MSKESGTDAIIAFGSCTGFKTILKSENEVEPMTKKENSVLG